MRLIIEVVIILLLSLPLSAQPSDVVISFGMSQSAVKDWRQGETSGYEISNSFKINHTFRLDTFKFRIIWNYASGVQYINNEKDDYELVLPTDNLFDLEAALIYPFGWKVDPTLAASVNTQVTESFRISKAEKIATSKLWDPVTSQQTFGFEYSSYSKSDFLTSRIGISWKQIRADKYTKLTDDFKTKNIKEKYKEQSGLSFKTNSKINLDKNTTYRGTLDLFTSFEDMKKWSIKFTNQINLKVFKAIGIVFNLNLIYDENQLAKLQYNQNLRFGLVIEP